MRQVDRRTTGWAPPERTWAATQPGSSQEGNTPPVSALRPPSRACLTQASLAEAGETTACLAVTPPGPARGQRPGTGLAPPAPPPATPALDLPAAASPPPTGCTTCALVSPPPSAPASSERGAVRPHEAGGRESLQVGVWADGEAQSPPVNERVSEGSLPPQPGVGAGKGFTSKQWPMGRGWGLQPK